MLPFFEESDEFTSTWTFGILALIVVYFAWRSTYVREDRPNSQGAVLVIEDNLRRRIQQPVNIHICEGDPNGVKGCKILRFLFSLQYAAHHNSPTFRT